MRLLWSMEGAARLALSERGDTMGYHSDRLEAHLLTRRELLGRSGMGFGALALAGMLSETSPAAAAVSTNPLAPRRPHFPGRAKRVLHLFMNGGPSQVDTFDPKPILDQYHGKPIPLQLRTERKTGAAYRSPFRFQKYGQSGIEVSELFARTAECIDDICVIRSMHANQPNHGPSLLLMNCGESRLIRPSLGSWVTYGLGSENQNLPGFIAMCPGGYPGQGTKNWGSAFLPGVFQGTYLDTQHADIDIEKLVEHIKNTFLPLPNQRRQLDLLRRLNEHHLERQQQDAQLEARIQSFELAYRMQLEATDAFDLSKEPPYIRDLYGPGVQARQILIARRLLERGVRYVQVYHELNRTAEPWDSHEDLEVKHRRRARECDQAIAALLKDLKQRGLLEDTLVIWGGEFGRTPVVEMPTPGSNNGRMNGRDHNHYGFTMWLAGGGVKGGMVYGATDEFGFQAVENKVHVHDLHATLLWLLGFDHEKLTYRHAGRDFRLTDVHGHVVKDILA
jgi:hypothetical protein